jgi:hypothetical protein
LDHLTSPGLAYSQILLARIYESLVLVNTVISWIRLADLNPCTTCTMYISLTIFLFRSGIAFYFHLFSTVQVTVRPKKNMCVYGHMSKKIQGRSALIFFNFFFLLSAKPEIVVPGIRFRYFIFEISGKPSFVEAVIWRVTQFFYLLCSQFRQKASGWINKTLLLIKQHI